MPAVAIHEPVLKAAQVVLIPDGGQELSEERKKKLQKRKQRIDNGKSNSPEDYGERPNQSYQSTSEQINEENGYDDSQSQEEGESTHETTWGDIKDPYKSGDNGTTRTANHLSSKKLIDELSFVTVEEMEAIMRYDPDTGMYRDDGENRIKGALAENLGEQYSTNRVREITSKIQSLTFVRMEEFTSPRNKICAQNGVLDLSDPENRFSWTTPRITTSLPELRLHTSLKQRMRHSWNS